jgi:hypothetical protein
MGERPNGSKESMRSLMEYDSKMLRADAIVPPDTPPSMSKMAHRTFLIFVFAPYLFCMAEMRRDVPRSLGIESYSQFVDGECTKPQLGMMIDGDEEDF